MTAQLLVRRDDVSVFHATWADLLAILPYRDDGTKVDAMIVDAPYSDRTHSAYRDMPELSRGAIVYTSWRDDDVVAFVDGWAPVVRGWFVTLTDHALAPVWERALRAHDRYVFAPLACVAPGSRVRICGDGPSNWSVWAVASRPRTSEWARWGSLPGAYVVPPGAWDLHATKASGRARHVVGGKPLWLMERLIEDYSRPGDLVCDPCCGGGTAIEAALRTGRRAVGGDQMREHAEMTAARVSRPVQRPLFTEGAA